MIASSKKTLSFDMQHHQSTLLLTRNVNCGTESMRAGSWILPREQRSFQPQLSAQGQLMRLFFFFFFFNVRSVLITGSQQVRSPEPRPIGPRARLSWRRRRICGRQDVWPHPVIYLPGHLRGITFWQLTGSFWFTSNQSGYRLSTAASGSFCGNGEAGAGRGGAAVACGLLTFYIPLSC